MRHSGSISIFVTPQEFFSERIDLVFSERKVRAPLGVRRYLVELLGHYLDAKNLFDSGGQDEGGNRKPLTLAEKYLLAHQSEVSRKVGLLKNLGDEALYVSGFFSDSLQRKLVDIEYYAEIGGAAYGSLAQCLREDHQVEVYQTFSQRFMEFVDVLSVFSRDSQIQSNQNILRMYERYIRTGSELDREKLVEMGLLNASSENLRKLPSA